MIWEVTWWHTPETSVLIGYPPNMVIGNFRCIVWTTQFSSEHSRSPSRPPFGELPTAASDKSKRCATFTARLRQQGFPCWNFHPITKSYFSWETTVENFKTTFLWPFETSSIEHRWHVVTLIRENVSLIIVSPHCYVSLTVVCEEFFISLYYRSFTSTRILHTNGVEYPDRQVILE